MPKRNKLRLYIRGYNYLRKNKKLYVIRAILNQICNLSINYSNDSFINRWFYSRIDSKIVNSAISSYIFFLFTTRAFKSELISAVAKNSVIKVATPPSWHSVLSSFNVFCDTFNSARWWGRIFIRYFYNIYECAGLLLTGHNSNSCSADSAHVFGLSVNSIPRPGIVHDSYNFITWYAKNIGINKPPINITHDVYTEHTCYLGYSIFYRASIFQGKSDNRRFLYSLVTLWFMALCALLELFFLKWSKALMLAEAFKAKMYSGTDPSLEYWFPHSEIIHRPLWSYIAEGKGAKIIVYFYSTSEQPFMNGVDESQQYEYGNCYWPNYVAWDDYQLNRIRRYADSRSIIDIYPAVDFSDAGNFTLKKKGVRAIAIFDVQPTRVSQHMGVTTLADYWFLNSNLATIFLEDIYDVLCEFGILMVYKGKRDIGNRGEKKYDRAINILKKRENFITAKSALSPKKIIGQTNAVISFPFTSTAIYAKEMNVPSVYYDPLGVLDKSDPAAHGILVLSGKEDLRSWVSSIYK